jgi:hypothetical protein
VCPFRLVVTGRHFTLNSTIGVSPWRKVKPIKRLKTHFVTPNRLECDLDLAPGQYTLGVLEADSDRPVGAVFMRRPLEVLSAPPPKGGKPQRK